ncbi:hypothetical protein J6590_056552 [Homalodisca vitripennis]|nr:hypothetical protein J6590_056552 [Homalodisca vitripennis]
MSTVHQFLTVRSLFMISVYRTQSLNIKNIESRARFGAMVGDCCGPCTVGGTGGMHVGDWCEWLNE